MLWKKSWTGAAVRMEGGHVKTGNQQYFPFYVRGA